MCNRLLARLYGTSARTSATPFRISRGADRRRLFRWAAEHGVDEVPALGAPAALPEAVSDGAHPWPPREAGAAAPGRRGHPEPWGVNVVGYFRSELGIGEAARQVVAALDAVGVPLLPVTDTTMPLNRQGHAYGPRDPADARFPVNLICMNADVLREFAEQAGADFFSGRYSIGLWFWEVVALPGRSGCRSFALLDEVWAPTRSRRRCAGPGVADPGAPDPDSGRLPAIVPRSRADLGLPEGFMFLFSFDYHSVFERKNPLAVVEAFRRAFAAGRRTRAWW